jgi:ribonuclease HI
LGLQKLKAMGVRRAILKTDSQVISGQVDKSSKARDPKLEKYVTQSEGFFRRFFCKKYSKRGK